MILGIDEVGRGPWAGPLVVGAVVLLDDHGIVGLTDSKKLSKKKREALDTEIRAHSAGFGLGWVEASEIDEVGLSDALRLACRRAVEQVTTPYHQIIIDGTINFLADTGKGKYVTTMKKADLLIASVSAASIIAKVARDKFMADQAALYPEYGFDAHVGYGTAQHAQALKAYGLTPLHRRSFAPIATIASGPDKSTSKHTGDAAEETVATHLQSLGYTIVDRNWKTKRCEIDIIAQHGETIYFVEVKHRRNARSGDGLAAITKAKLRQMSFAAELYRTKMMKDERRDIQLMVASTSGLSPQIDALFALS